MAHIKIKKPDAAYYFSFDAEGEAAEAITKEIKAIVDTKHLRGEAGLQELPFSIYIDGENYSLMLDRDGPGVTGYSISYTVEKEPSYAERLAAQYKRKEQEALDWLTDADSRYEAIAVAMVSGLTLEHLQSLKNSYGTPKDEYFKYMVLGKFLFETLYEKKLDEIFNRPTE